MLALFDFSWGEILQPELYGGCFRVFKGGIKTGREVKVTDLFAIDRFNGDDLGY